MMTRTTRRWRVRCGFTLMESIATIVILAILGSIASFLVVDAVDGYVSASGSAQLHAEGSLALDRIMRELRKIELDPALDPTVAPHIDAVTANSITWDETSTGVHSLSWSATAGDPVMLQIDGAAAIILIDDITGFTVSTFDAANLALPAVPSAAERETIRRIAVVLTIQRSGITESVQTKLFIRSTMSGGGT